MWLSRDGQGTVVSEVVGPSSYRESQVHLEPQPPRDQQGTGIAGV